MRRDVDSQRASLDMKAVFSLGELASFARVPRHTLRRLLEKNRVKFVRAGRSLFVPVSEVKERIPALWKSMRLLEEVRVKAIEKARAEEEGARTVE